MEVISIKLDRDQEYLAMIGGKNLIKEKEELHHLFVYKISNLTNFKLIVNHRLKGKYNSFSKAFDFCYRDDLPNPGHSLLLLDREEIVHFDFMQKNFD